MVKYTAVIHCTVAVVRLGHEKGKPVCILYGIRISWLVCSVALIALYSAVQTISTAKSSIYTADMLMSSSRAKSVYRTLWWITPIKD